MIRDIQRSIMSIEAQFDKKYGVCLNEAMVLCSLKNEGKLYSGTIAKLLGLTPSNASKVISMTERHGLVKRGLCRDDTTTMCF